MIVAGIMSATIAWGAGMMLNNDFTRTQCGTAYKKVLKEISGLACSRTTPGYLWAHGDENIDDKKRS